MTNWTQLSPSRLLHCGSFLVYGMTNVGRVRKANEDNFLIDEALGLCVVGDGMGGHAAGEVASAEALRAVRDFVQTSLNQQALPDGDDATVPRFQPDEDDTVPHFTPAATKKPVFFDPDATWSDGSMPAVETMFAAVDHANQRLYKKNVANFQPEGRGMGTTLVGWWQFVPGAPIVIFNVGDSRLYLLRAGQMSQLTKDQTLYQQAIDFGQTDYMPARNLLLQAVGPSDNVTPEVFTHSTKVGDIYLLCSDGLHSGVSDEEILGVLRDATSDNLPQICTDLIALANQCGGKDNITVLLASCWA